MIRGDKENLYPSDFESFIDWFPTEQSCVDYIEKVRWPEGYRCSQCNSSEYWRTERGILHCKNCGHQKSPTSGTVFEDTRKPLRLWFHVMWLMMAQKHGTSARNLCSTFDFGSYQTIWGWLQKLRSVMVLPRREKLAGIIEVDEMYIGGFKPGKVGRGATGKQLVAIAVEVREKHLGRVRLKCIPHADALNLESFVLDYVASGATVRTDGWPSYSQLKNLGFAHEVQSSTAKVGDCTLKHVHLVVSLIKRWLGSTHQGAVSPEHLQAYLDEYAFRFNRRLSTHRGKLFYRLMQQAVSCRPPSIKDLYISPLDVGAT